MMNPQTAGRKVIRRRRELRRRALTRAIERSMGIRVDGATDICGTGKMNVKRSRLAGWAVLALDHDFDFFVSINTNDASVGFVRAAKWLRHFDAKVNRFLLGANWSKRRAWERASFIAFPERSGGKLHFHLLLRLPPKLGDDFDVRMNLEQFIADAIPAIGLFPHGDVDVEDVSDNNDIAEMGNKIAIVRYVVKQTWRDEQEQEIVLSQTFQTR